MSINLPEPVENDIRCANAQDADGINALEITA